MYDTLFEVYAWQKKAQKKQQKKTKNINLNTFGELMSNCIILFYFILFIYFFFFFFGFGDGEKNNFREQRKIFSGSLYYLFSGNKGVLIFHDGGLCEATKHLDCNSLKMHNSIRNKIHMYKG